MKKITNANVKVMANGVALCPVCHKFFSTKNLTDAEIDAINANGACVKCAPVVTAPVKKTVSAFKQVRQMILSANLNTAQVALLMDKSFTQKRTGIAYQMLVPVIEAKTIVKYGKARYAKKTITINEVEYFLTNDIYDRNVGLVEAMLDSIVR